MLGSMWYFRNRTTLASLEDEKSRWSGYGRQPVEVAVARWPEVLEVSGETVLEGKDRGRGKMESGL